MEPDEGGSLTMIDEDFYLAFKNCDVVIWSMSIGEEETMEALAEAFAYMTGEQYERAAALLVKCRTVIDAGAPRGPLNERNSQLLDLAREKHIPAEAVPGENAASINL